MMGTIATLTTLGMVYAMSRNSGNIITSTYAVFSILILGPLIVLGIFLATAGSPVGILLSSISALFYFLLKKLESRIAFGSANIKVGLLLALVVPSYQSIFGSFSLRTYPFLG